MSSDGVERYFSDREAGAKPQVSDEVTVNLWGGIRTLVERLLNSNMLAMSFPLRCDDPPFPVCGADDEAFYRGLRGEVPDLPARLWDQVPEVPLVMDLVEFLFDNVRDVTNGQHHAFWDHHHLRDTDQGYARGDVVAGVNRLFQRNGLAYELTRAGRIERLGPPLLRTQLAAATFRTGDSELDDLLNRAREKFRSPELDDRRDALEKLWDAYERLKSSKGPSKPRSVEALIASTGLGEPFRERLDEEMRALTNIGNQFRIRHAEVNQHPVETSEQVDYLFGRLFSLIWLLLGNQKG